VLTQFAVRACSAIFDNWPHYHVRLSLSEIKSEHSDGVIRRELVSGECALRTEQPVALAHPCSERDVSVGLTQRGHRLQRRCRRRIAAAGAVDEVEVIAVGG